GPSARRGGGPGGGGGAEGAGARAPSHRPPRRPGWGAGAPPAGGPSAARRGNPGAPRRPAHYLAIPPMLFGPVVGQLGSAGCARGARVIVEKPFGRDLASARALNRTLLSTFDEASIFRIDHYLGKEPVQNLVYFRFANS